MPDRAFGRRAVLEGAAIGGIGSLLGAGDVAGGIERRTRRTTASALERHTPAASEVSVVPGSTLLFELEAPVGFDPGDVEWGGDGETGGGGTPLATDYEYAAGVPATFRTFDSPGTHRVTAMYGANESTAWTVHVDPDGARPPEIDLRSEPGDGERVGVDDPVTFTAESSARDGTLEYLVWVEGQNMTVPDVTDLEGETDSATLVREPPGWTSAGYPTSAIAVSETGVLSDAASVDGPEIRPPLAVRIVETNDPVLAGERLEVVAEVENVGDTMMIGDPTQELEFVVGEDPEVVDARTVAVDWPETERVSFAFETYPVDHDDRFPVRVVGADDADERTVEVVARDDSDSRAGVDVTIVRTNAPVRAGEPLEVVAEVANAGTERVSREVTLVVGHDPETVDSTTVALEAGERETVRLGYRTYPAAQTTEFPVVVDAGDGSDERSVRVWGTAD
ncbi:CARDB domain-containing protein [Natrialba sp. INN-245]|uniref:CARDB domain-containing protein n=1 Tax=Natrialba sp. INN-245 TaxID=2690967 RepID=UPI00190FAE31|nr:CARDB domain-containing protein [Natrialba sp. INN-245]